MLRDDPAIGLEINSYQIIEILGQGGMGRVYRAQHPHIGKQVAIKLLKPEISEQPDAVQRFFQEARAVNNIHHENVIDVLDFGKTPKDEYFLLMEFLQGKSLGDAIKGEAPFPETRVGHIGLQICSALAAAHEKGIIHRDLKPDNIFLIARAGRKDFVKVLDFGLAKLLHNEEGVAQTTTGMVLGTPLYMAPEQALGKPLDPQTDIYALGVILYQMATGSLPFFDANPVALATMHVTQEPPSPRKFLRTISAGLEKVILRCLQKDRTARYATMVEVAEALAEACDLSTGRYFGRSSPLGEEEEELKNERTVITSMPGEEREDVADTFASGAKLAPISEEKSRFGQYGIVLGALSLLVLGVVALYLAISASGGEEPPARQAAAPQVAENQAEQPPTPLSGAKAVETQPASPQTAPATSPVATEEAGSEPKEAPENLPEKNTPKHTPPPRNNNKTRPPNNKTRPKKTLGDTTLDLKLGSGKFSGGAKNQ